MLKVKIFFSSCPQAAALMDQIREMEVARHNRRPTLEPCSTSYVIAKIAALKIDLSCRIISITGANALPKLNEAYGIYLLPPFHYFSEANNSSGETRQ